MINKFANSEHFISCDWGTTTMRLYLVNAKTGATIDSVDSKFGIKRIHSDWEIRKAEYSDKADFFIDILNDHVLLLQQKSQQVLTDIPVIGSGMITSSIGMKHLDYAGLPFDIYGRQVMTDFMPANDKFEHDLLLVSGVCSQDDVMRGEETQAIGLMSRLKVNNGICIFPGTHSKHLYVEAEKIVDFKTYMTGELFDVLAQNSILRESVMIANNYDEQAFKEGVKTGSKGNILHELFGIRGKSLLQDMAYEASRNFMSGLLIGCELSDMDVTGNKLYLCGGEILEQYYAEALHTLFPSDKIEVISSNVVEGLVVKGHLTILYNMNQNN